MTDQERRIQACIDHINTAVDVDPWAKKLAEQALRYMNVTSTLPNCNDCGVIDCSIRPEWGKQVRINCYGWKEKIESEVLETITRIGVNVDKDELISALNYDRQQYEMGYSHGAASKKKLIDRINEWLSPDIDMELALERIRAIIYEETTS